MGSRRKPAPVPVSAFQRRLARVSRWPLSALIVLPRWVPAVVVAVLLVGGLAVTGVVGAVLLLLVAAFLTWLLLLSWPTLDHRARGTRLLVTAALVLAAAYQVTR